MKSILLLASLLSIGLLFAGDESKPAKSSCCSKSASAAAGEKACSAEMKAACDAVKAAKGEKGEGCPAEMKAACEARKAALQASGTPAKSCCSATTAAQTTESESKPETKPQG